MTGAEADIIIEMRDVLKYPWKTIEDKVGYSMNAIKNNYDKRKAGRKYFDDYKETIYSFDLAQTDIKDIYKVVQEKCGYPYNYDSFRIMCNAHSVPFHRSTTKNEELFKLFEEIAPKLGVKAAYIKVYKEYYRTVYSFEWNRPRVYRRYRNE